MNRGPRTPGLWDPGAWDELQRLALGVRCRSCGAIAGDKCRRARDGELGRAAPHWSGVERSAHITRLEDARDTTPARARRRRRDGGAGTAAAET